MYNYDFMIVIFITVDFTNPFSNLKCVIYLSFAYTSLKMSMRFVENCRKSLCIYNNYNIFVCIFLVSLSFVIN
jgi:hypothetical protein